jgi:hypothetical protein
MTQTFELLKKGSNIVEVVGYISKDQFGYLKLHLNGWMNPIVACDGDGRIVNVDDFVGTISSRSKSKLCGYFNCRYGYTLAIERNNAYTDLTLYHNATGKEVFNNHFHTARECTGEVALPEYSTVYAPTAPMVQ